MMGNRDFQERYWLYSLCNGNFSCDKQEGQDRIKYPNDYMRGYREWINFLVDKYKKETKIENITDQMAFNEWVSGHITFNFNHKQEPSHAED